MPIGPRGPRRPPIDRRDQAQIARRLRERFAELRARGVRPHRYDVGDDQVAAQLAHHLAAEGARYYPPYGESGGDDDGSDPLDTGGGGGQGGSDEDEGDGDDGPNPGRAGINFLPFTRDTSDGIFGDEPHQIGNGARVLVDLERMGVRVIRQVGDGDLRWDALFPDSPIASPSAIHDWLLGLDYYNLTNQTLLLVLCQLYGIKVAFTLFCYGGFGNEHKTLLAKSAADVAAAEAGQPGFERGMVFPSLKGWDPFYWDFGDGEGSERDYEKWALSLHVPDGESSSYRNSCARRKGVAVAAFADGIGRWMAQLPDDLRDTIAWVECGNELDTRWPNLGMGSCEDFVASDNYRETATQHGRFLGLLAGPVIIHAPKVKVAASALKSYALASEGGYDGKWEMQVRWVCRTIKNGLTDEVKRWKDLLADGGDPWWDACTKGGFRWPVHGCATDATTLVHRVSFHWYHDNDSGVAPEYRTARGLMSDVNIFNDRLRTYCEGFTLPILASEVGFHAVNAPKGEGSPYYSYLEAHVGIHDASWRPAMFQAGMLVRLVTTAAALKVRRSVVHTFRTTPQDFHGKWDSSLHTTGVRNDVNYGDDDWDFAVDAWQRPAWYAFRKLQRILRRTREASSLYMDNDEVVVLELALGADTRLGGLHGARWVYLAWRDQESYGSTTLTFTSDTATSWAPVSLVPSTARPSRATTDGYYAELAADWRWEGWDWFRPTESSSGGGLKLKLPLQQASVERPNPACLAATSRLTLK